MNPGIITDLIDPRLIFSAPALLSIGVILFGLGFYTAMVRQNMIAILMGIELLLNGVALNFASLAYFSGNEHGRIMTLFIIALAALESVVALAVILAIFKTFRTSHIDRASAMHE